MFSSHNGRVQGGPGKNGHTAPVEGASTMSIVAAKQTKINTDTTRGFLDRVWGKIPHITGDPYTTGQQLRLTAQLPDGTRGNNMESQGISRANLAPAALGGLIKWAVDKNTDDYAWAQGAGEQLGSVWFNVAGRKPGITAARTRGGLKDLTYIPALWCDIDHVPDPARDQVVEWLLTRAPVTPTYVLWTGGGVSAFWLLREAVDVGTTDKANDFTRRHKAVITGIVADLDPILTEIAKEHQKGTPEGKRVHFDHSVYNADRIMRLPGLYNRKQEYADPLSLILFEGTTEYDYATLCGMFPYVPPKEVAKAKQNASRGDQAALLRPKAKGKQARIDRAVSHIEAAIPGDGEHGRNKTLFNMAQLLSGKSVGGLVDESEARAALTDAGVRVGLPLSEVEKTVESGMKIGAMRPIYDDARPQTGGPIKFNEHGPLSFDEQHPPLDSGFVLACYADNEVGDARLLKALIGPKVAFDNGSKLWHLWTGFYFRADDGAEMLQAPDLVVWQYRYLAREIEDQIVDLSKQLGAVGDDKEAAGKLKEKLTGLPELVAALKGRVKALQGVARRKRVLEYLASLRGVAGDAWDKIEGKIPCLSGLIDLATGVLTPSTPDDYIRTVAPVEYSGLHTPAPKWETFISEIMPGEKEAAFMHRLLGYAASGTVQHNIFPILWGEGFNGKSVLLHTVMRVLGPLVHRARAEVFMAKHDKNSDSATPSLMALQGKRIVYASETRPGAQLDEEFIKAISGRDPVTGRHLYGREVTFDPTLTAFLLTNNKPVIPAHASAVWERLILVPFPYKFVDQPTEANEKRIDRALASKLEKEAAGILAWLVRGYHEYLSSGLDTPESLLALKAKYQRAEDVLQHFIDEHCTVGTDRKAPARGLYESYRAWAMENGYKYPNERTFSERLEQKTVTVKGDAGQETAIRFKKDRRKSGMVWLGIGLQESAPRSPEGKPGLAPLY